MGKERGAGIGRQNNRSSGKKDARDPGELMA